MPCIITAPSSGSGKTLLSLVLTAWANDKGLSIQPFKVGPDYLDSQLLSAVSKRTCRNLDLVLCNKSWVKRSFNTYGATAELVLVEGVMGLFDGIGSSHKGSTADIAKHLNLPIVLTINARGQAASIAALVKGFQNQDPSIRLAGVVLNQVNTQRHKELLIEVLDSINVKVLGSLPKDTALALPSRHLGLIQANEIKDLYKRIDSWIQIAEKYLDLHEFQKLLKAPENSKEQTIHSHTGIINNQKSLENYPIAIAEDKAFNFRYPEIKEYLESLGMPLINWMPTKNEPIPDEAKGLIIPGGFPEQFAEEISHASKSLKSIQIFFGKHPIYAECGGMLLLGKSLQGLDGKSYPMSNLLPFNAQKGSLKVGYRTLRALKDSLILNKGDELIGHEFHYWEVNNINSKSIRNDDYKSFYPWEIEGWKINSFQEGWANNHLHASWIHLHWPSSSKIMVKWFEAVKKSTI
tara:strand:- start:69 stop:1460 length:1392 start_codon:yes stop_codon:yes gene_type:complete